MTFYRPPIGGLFRVSAPRSAATEQAGPNAQAEAREAIRNFMSVLEKLDRQVAASPAPPRSARAPGARAARTRNKRTESQP